LRLQYDNGGDGDDDGDGADDGDVMMMMVM